MLKAGANLQDTCVRHGFSDPGTVVEENSHISHGAALHSSVVRRDALVGMNAVVMDDAQVGEQSIVAVCAFVPAGMHAPPLPRVCPDKSHHSAGCVSGESWGSPTTMASNIDTSQQLGADPELQVQNTE